MTLTPRRLAAEVRRLTATPAEWVTRVRLDHEGRWYERIHMTGGYEVWLISWLPGQSTGFHDHGGSAGAFGVVWGALDECVVPPGADLRGDELRQRGTPAPRTPRPPRPPRKTGESRARVSQVAAGDVRAFGPRYVHDVRNSAAGSVAVSLHAYSPPLPEMTRYDLTPGGLVVAGTEGENDW